MMSLLLLSLALHCLLTWHALVKIGNHALGCSLLHVPRHSSKNRMMMMRSTGTAIPLLHVEVHGSTLLGA